MTLTDVAIRLQYIAGIGLFDSLYTLPSSKHRFLLDFEEVFNRLMQWAYLLEEKWTVLHVLDFSKIAKFNK